MDKQITDLITILENYWKNQGNDYFVIQTQHNLYYPKLSSIEFCIKDNRMVGTIKLSYSKGEISKIVVSNKDGVVEKFSNKKGDLLYFFERLAEVLGCLSIINEDQRQTFLF